jgi:DNA-binding transcriptional MerR regulator
LLKPARIDRQTGYRYYSAKQLPRLNRILALKELGFPLDQIREMLQAEISDAAIEGMLLLKKTEVEQTVLEELRRLHVIEARLQQNRLGDEVPARIKRSYEGERARGPDTICGVYVMPKLHIYFRSGTWIRTTVD